jgi:hypothetical protein
LPDAPSFEGVPSYRIYSIQRVEVPALYHKYALEVGKLPAHTRRFGMLFHGTSSRNPLDVIQSEEGLDPKLSRAGMWGRGIYFASNVRTIRSSGPSYPCSCQQRTLARISSLLWCLALLLPPQLRLPQRRLHCATTGVTVLGPIGVTFDYYNDHVRSIDVVHFFGIFGISHAPVKCVVIIAAH